MRYVTAALLCAFAGAGVEPRAAVPAHWAFKPITDPAIPAVRNVSWGKESLDNFVLARLEANDLRPAQREDRPALIRRASYDLTGLPPSPGEVEEFVADETPEAFARVVDRLLSSPHFGERWAARWLEIVGYADIDASGAALRTAHENAWRYRDYVIAAFNTDKPYDEFIREQLAGDLLQREEEVVAKERLVATGFLLVGIAPPTAARSGKLNLDIADRQIELATRTFLGLTAACARCHDHKSDPITMREYYGLAGIFTSTDSLEDPVERGRRAGPRLLERSLATPEQLIEMDEYETQFEELKEQLRDAREMHAAFPGEIDSASLAGVVVDNLAAEIHGAWKESNYSTNFVDRNYLHDANADKGRKSARFVPDITETGVYEVLVSYTPHPNRATNVPVTITSKAGTKVVYVDQRRAPTVDKVFTPVGKFTFEADANNAISISNEGTKGFVVVDAVRLTPVLESSAGSSDAQADETSGEIALLSYRQLEKAVLEFHSKRPILPRAMAVRDGRIRDCRLRLGGDSDRLGDPVPRGFPNALGTPNSTLYVITDESSGRLELANWIARPDNPLTARVAVNRVWAALFGQGLVRTLDDFGVSGDRPAHPELLDHLAKRFIHQKWSVKRMIRAMMLSSTYQMGTLAASVPPRDPENRLLWRMNPQQLGPDEARNTALALSGELDQSMGGSWLPANAAFGTLTQTSRRVQESSRRRTIYLPVIRDRMKEQARAPQCPALVKPARPTPQANTRRR